MSIEGASLGAPRVCVQTLLFFEYAWLSRWTLSAWNSSFGLGIVLYLPSSPQRRPRGLFHSAARILSANSCTAALGQLIAL